MLCSLAGRGPTGVGDSFNAGRVERGVGVTGGFLAAGVPRGVGGDACVGGGVSVGQVSEAAVGSTSTVGDGGVCSGEARVGIGDCSDSGWQPTSPSSKAQARISALGEKCCFIPASLGKERQMVQAGSRLCVPRCDLR